MKQRLSLLLICMLLLTACSSETTYTSPAPYTTYSRPVTNYHVEQPEQPKPRLLAPKFYSEVSYNYACSINAVYNSNNRLWYYSYASVFTTDGMETKMYNTTKFLGNYGVQPIDIIPHAESANGIYVDFNEFYTPQDYDIKKTDENEYDWYFFTPKLLKDEPLTIDDKCIIKLSDISFRVSLEFTNDAISCIHMQNITKTEVIDSIEIILVPVNGGDIKSTQ